MVVIGESDLNLDSCTRLFLPVYNSVLPFSVLFPKQLISRWFSMNSRQFKAAGNFFVHFSQNNFGFGLRKKTILVQGLSLVQEFEFNVCVSRPEKSNQDSLVSTKKIARFQEFKSCKIARFQEFKSCSRNSRNLQFWFKKFKNFASLVQELQKTCWKIFGQQRCN